jgi:hypothetical protein
MVETAADAFLDKSALWSALEKELSALSISI